MLGLFQHDRRRAAARHIAFDASILPLDAWNRDELPQPLDLWSRYGQIVVEGIIHNAYWHFTCSKTHREIKGERKLITRIKIRPLFERLQSRFGIHTTSGTLV